MTIAVSHPGKHGDCLYALPTAKALAKRHNTQVDFYTSIYCAPLKVLFECQPYIRRFIVSPTYVIERMDMGIQPPVIPLEEWEYEAVYHLGFRGVPDCAIPDYMAHEVGVEIEPISYNVPRLAHPEPGTYVVLAPRGDTSYNSVFQEFMRLSPVPVYLIGGAGDNGVVRGEFDMTGCDYLETTALIAGAQAFVGLMSSQLALANGFPIPRIAPHDGKSWDMRHIVRSEWNQYPVLPSAEQLWQLINWYQRGKPMQYNKTADEVDYATSDNYDHIKNMQTMLMGAHNGWLTEYRKWEYGGILQALRENGARTVLDVGGGSSIFAASAIWCGMDVTVVDPDDYSAMFAEQSRRIGKPIPFIHQDFFDFQTDQQFDAVVCISTIEHVEQDARFFQKLLTLVKPGGLLGLTTDFCPIGVAMVGGHIRCYNAEMLNAFIEIGRDEGFEIYGDGTSYSHFEPNVAGLYSFARIVLKKVK